MEPFWQRWRQHFQCPEAVATEVDGSTQCHVLAGLVVPIAELGPSTYNVNWEFFLIIKSLSLDLLFSWRLHKLPIISNKLFP